MEDRPGRLSSTFDFFFKLRRDFIRGRRRFFENELQNYGIQALECAPSNRHDFAFHGTRMSRIEKPYVLVVDDDEATCTLIAAILRRDFAVECVNDALEAIEKLRVNNYGVVILDLRMPQSDGFAVLDFVKQTKPGTLPNILIVTALLSPSEIERARTYGICAIVSKPFDVDALLEAVRQCVGDGDGGRLSNVFCSSTPMILLLADLLRQRLG